MNHYKRSGRTVNMKLETKAILFIYVLRFSDQFNVSLMIVFMKLHKLSTKI